MVLQVEAATLCAAHVQRCRKAAVFALIGSAGHRQCSSKRSELDAAAVQLSLNRQDVGHRPAETIGAVDQQHVAGSQVVDARRDS
jgi:hypothetical protein